MNAPYPTAPDSPETPSESHAAPDPSKAHPPAATGTPARTDSHRRSLARTIQEKVLFVLAWLVLGLGAIGVVLPILPTTPLVLLASLLFAKSSPRFDAWLQRTRLYRSYVVPFRESGGMTARKKIAMFSVTAATCGLSFALVSFLPARIILAAVVCGMGFALLRIIKTISPEEDARLRAQWTAATEAE